MKSDDDMSQQIHKRPAVFCKDNDKSQRLWINENWFLEAENERFRLA